MSGEKRPQTLVEFADNVTAGIAKSMSRLCLEIEQANAQFEELGNQLKEKDAEIERLREEIKKLTPKS